jgi:uncharacterized protein (TIGR01777 family)
MAAVLIAGGTGLIGTRLSHLLKDAGHEVLHLSRKRKLDAEFPAYGWDLQEGHIDEEALQKASHIVNLAGAGIADKPWTERRKRQIIDSRVTSNRVIKNYLEREEFDIKAYISGSAIGYYGDQGDQILHEDTNPTKQGFLSESVIQWEQAIKSVAATGIRTVTFRIGLVLSTRGGALEKILIPFHFRLGTYFGSGKQWYAWIHIDDLCQMFIQAIEDDKMAGIFNAVAPNPLTNKDFTANIAKAMDKTVALLPAPSFALRLAMGEMADAVLTSARVSSEKILNYGFEFSFPELVPAVQDLISKKI